jgi:hypothetical protein
LTHIKKIGCFKLQVVEASTIMGVKNPHSHTFTILRFGVLGGGCSFVAKDCFLCFWVLCVFYGSSRVGRDDALANACDVITRFNQSNSRNIGKSSRNASATFAS